MRFSYILAPLVAAATFATGTLAQLVINTPVNVVVCEPVLLTWSGGEAPYFLDVVPGDDPTAPALVEFDPQTETSLIWIANIPAGTIIGLLLRDSTGVIAQSAPFEIQSGPDTTCL